MEIILAWLPSNFGLFFCQNRYSIYLFYFILFFCEGGHEGKVRFFFFNPVKEERYPS